MRVGYSCLLWTDRPRGVGRTILSLARALLRTRGGQEFVLYLPPALSADELGPEARQPGVHLVRAPSWTRSRAGRILWEQVGLPRRGARDRLDVLQAPGYVLPLRMRSPVVLLVHDLIALEHPELCSWLNRCHYGLALPASIRRASHVVTFSSEVKRQVEERFGRSNVRVVLPGVDDAFFAPLGEQELTRVRRRYGLPPRFVLFAGNAEPKKNLTRLIEAYRIARRSGQVDGHLVLTRGAPTRRLGDDVQALGFVPERDLAALFRLARVLAFPSLSEGFGLPVLEAMVSGTPVVCSRVPAVEESDPAAVVLVESRDVCSIAEGLVRAWSDEDHRRDLIARGRAAAEGFRWERTATELWRLYARTVSEPRPGPPARSR
jgi:glycosyltransferase involved in cell wall biosynthesis